MAAWLILAGLFAGAPAADLRAGDADPPGDAAPNLVVTFDGVTFEQLRQLEAQGSVPGDEPGTTERLRAQDSGFLSAISAQRLALSLAASHPSTSASGPATPASGPGEASSDPCAGEAPSLADQLTRARRAAHLVLLDKAEEELAAARASLACSASPVYPEQLSRLRLLEGVVAAYSDHPSCQASFREALDLYSAVAPPTEFGAKVMACFEAASTSAQGALVPLDLPPISPLVLWIDGRPAGSPSARLPPGTHALQVATVDGRVLRGEWFKVAPGSGGALVALTPWLALPSREAILGELDASVRGQAMSDTLQAALDAYLLETGREWLWLIAADRGTAIIAAKQVGAPPSFRSSGPPPPPPRDPRCSRASRWTAVSLGALALGSGAINALTWRQGVLLEAQPPPATPEAEHEIQAAASALNLRLWVTAGVGVGAALGASTGAAVCVTQNRTRDAQPRAGLPGAGLQLSLGPLGAELGARW